MPNIVNLIPPSFLRSRTDIGVNYNETNVSNAVANAQEFELLDIIGRNLLDSLQDHVVALSSVLAVPIPAAYKTLLDEYVAPYVVWTSYYNLLESIYLKPTSVGLGQQAFPGGTASSPAQYEKKRESVRPKVDHYALRLREYIVDEGSSIFVELSTQEDLPSDRRKTLTSTSSPLVTSRRYKRGPNIN